MWLQLNLEDLNTHKVVNCAGIYGMCSFSLTKETEGHFLEGKADKNGASWLLTNVKWNYEFIYNYYNCQWNKQIIN